MTLKIRIILLHEHEISPDPTGATADAPASRIDKKKSSPEKCIFFLPIRFHLTLILKL